MNLIQDQLGSIAAFHYMSVMGPTGAGEMTTEEFAPGRSTASNGDHAFFVRLMTRQTFNLRDDRDAIQNLYFGTDIRKRHTENYVATFEKLLKEAREVDKDGMISNALLRGSATGRQYRIIKYIQGEDIHELELYV